MIKTEILEINGQQFRHTWSDDGMMIERDGVEYEEAYDPIGTGRTYTETAHAIEVIIDSIEELEQAYHDLLDRYGIAERKAQRLERIRAAIEDLRDKALLPSTKVIYEAILELFED